MAIEMTYEELLNLNTALTNIADVSEKEIIPIPLEMWIIRLIKKSKEPMLEYTMLRDKLLKKLGTEIFTENKDQLDKGGKPILLPTGRFEMTTPENKIEYTEKLKELNETACKIEGNVFKKTVDIYKELPRLSIRTKLFLEPVLEESTVAEQELREVDLTENKE